MLTRASRSPGLALFIYESRCYLQDVKAIQKPLESYSESRQDSGLFPDVRRRIFFFSKRNALKALKTPRSFIHPRAKDIPSFLSLLGTEDPCVDSPFPSSPRGRAERAERAGHENRLLGGDVPDASEAGSVCDRSCFLSFAFACLTRAVDCAWTAGSSGRVRSTKTGRGHERSSIAKEHHTHLPQGPVAPRVDLWGVREEHPRRWSVAVVVFDHL